MPILLTHNNPGRLVLLPVLILLTVACQTYSFVDDFEGHKSKPKSVHKIVYKIEEQDSVIWFNNSTSYLKDGRKDTYTKYKEDGSVFGTPTKYEYSNKDRYYCQKNFDHDGNLSSEVCSFYDKHNMLVRRIIKSKNKISSTHYFTYDRANLMLRYHLNENQDTSYISRHTYNSDNQLTQVISGLTCSQLLSTTIYKYNSRGKVSEKIAHRRNGTISDIDQYQYNLNADIINEKSFDLSEDEIL